MQCLVSVVSSCYFRGTSQANKMQVHKIQVHSALHIQANVHDDEIPSSFQHTGMLRSINLFFGTNKTYHSVLQLAKLGFDNC